MKLRAWCLVALPLLLTGCVGGLSGYGGSSSFKCAAPEGVSCNSISGNYANSIAGNDLSGNVTGANNIKTERYFPNTQSSSYQPNNRFTPSSGMPVRTQSEVMRIWIAPYQDNDGDLVDQSYTYVTLNEGRWLIEHNRKQIMDEYQPQTRLLGGGNTPVEANERKTEEVDTVPNILPLPGDFPKK
ncbi:type IV conjugative transfer system lipoprotein TraV [Neisseria sp. Ec49-e6-T10]|uniref:type IV conjugative transfer system lipoprotein TraV n=1 Tax=Neisseria sp. Ec49-e6-T10 TaxID=3140744 RepID=UPI003EBC7E5A